MDKFKEKMKALWALVKKNFTEKKWLKWVSLGVAVVLIGVIVLCSLTMCKSDVPTSSSSAGSGVSSNMNSSQPISSDESDSSSSEADSSTEEIEVPKIPAADNKTGSQSSFEYEYSEELNGYILTSIGDYSAPKLVIETTYHNDGEEWASVKKIADGVCEGNSSLKVVVIPNTIMYIGNNAFANCENLYRVEMGQMVQQIGANAFQGCDNLTIALFANKSGWSVDSIKLDAAQIANYTDAANLLKGDYCGYDWKFSY